MKVKAKDVVAAESIAEEIQKCLRVIASLEDKLSYLFSRVRNKMNIDYSPADDEFDVLYSASKQMDEARSNLDAAGNQLKEVFEKIKGV